MAIDGTAFAGASILVDTDTVGKVTSWEWAVSIETESVSGSEDTEGTAPNQITRDKQKPVSVSKTASMEGIYIPADTGQTDLKAAAETGSEVDIKHEDQAGYGEDATGYLTNFTVTGSLGNVYTFSADFHANSDTAVTPGA